MYQVSSELRAALTSGLLHIRITTADGTELDHDTLTYTASCASGTDITIGSVCAAMIRCKLYGAYDLQDAPISVEAGAEVDGAIQYVPLGRFYVTSQERAEDTTTITAYDAAYYALGADYAPTVASGSKVASVLADIAAQTGITLAALPSAAATTAVTGDLTGHTCREMVGYMAALVGCNAIIDRDGKLSLRWFTDAGQTATPDDYYSGGLSLTGTSTLAGVQMTKTIKVQTTGEDGTTTETDQTTVYDAGSGSGTVIAIDNPFATQAIVDNLWAKIGGLGAYRAGSCAMFGGVLTEPGDLISVTDLDGVTSVVPAMTVVLELDGGCKCTVSAVGQSETAVAANVMGPTGKALVQIMADIARFKRVYAQNLEAELAKIDNLYADSAWVQKLFSQYIEATNLHITGGSTFDGELDAHGTLTSYDDDGSYAKFSPTTLEWYLIDPDLPARRWLYRFYRSGYHLHFQGNLIFNNGINVVGNSVMDSLDIYGTLSAGGTVEFSQWLKVAGWIYGAGRVYSNGKTGIGDGADGCMLDDGLLVLARAVNPGINFYRGGATTSATSYLREIADGTLAVSKNLSVPGNLTQGGLAVPRMQRGSAAVTGVTSTPVAFSVTFATAFAGTPQVMLSPLRDSRAKLYAKVRKVSASGFTADVWGDSTTAADITVQWTAIY